ncbi:MAG: hypothetical protein ACI4DV_03270 [Lachnospiraceae bacterium]
MSKIKNKLSEYSFLILLLLFFLAFDHMIEIYGENTNHIVTNDFEVTRANHPEKVWDKVFYGNSSVISGYREDLSESGYVNLGIDYGVITDLWEMIRQGHIEIGSDLVIGLELLSFYDEFETNPAYIWHRKPMEPYCYFHRDKLFEMLTDTAKKMIGRGNGQIGVEDKIHYYGNISDEELAQKEDKFAQIFYNLPIEVFEENIAALDKIDKWCDENGVRLRLVWMPLNPKADFPELAKQVYDKVGKWSESAGVEVADYMDYLDETCFYDSSHINYEYGAYIFTEGIDQWLNN